MRSGLALAILMLASSISCAQSLKNITPASVTQYTTAPTLVISGNGFKPNDPVYVGVTQVTATYVNSTKLQAVLPQALINQNGTYAIRVRNSGILNFTVILYQPQLVSVTPSTVVNNQSYVLDVYGSQFVPGAAVTFNNIVCSTEFIDSLHLRFSIDKSLLTGLAGQYPVMVYNP